MAVTNNEFNPQFIDGRYIEKMRTGFANAKTDWEMYTPVDGTGQSDIASQILRGTMTFSKDKLKELDPSYTGYTHIFVLRMPYFMELLKAGHILPGYDNEGIAKAKYHYNNLKALIEMGSTSYSGTPNLTMDTADVDVGWSERNYAAPLKSQYDGTQFTIRCLEVRNEPLRHAMEYYINCITDANGKFASMGGAVNPNNYNKPLEPSLANYTFSIMVVQTDQTLLRIQNIDLWNNCIFTEAPRDNLDWTQGTIEIVQPRDIQFRGIYLPVTDNEIVFKKAVECMKTRVLYYKRIQDLTTEDLRLDMTEDELRFANP